MKNFLKNDLFMSVISGLLLIAGWPPISLTPLLLGAFVPLTLVINRQTSLKKIWGYSYLTFFVWTLGTMYWIANTKLNFQGMIVIVIAWTLIPLFQSLPFMIFGWVNKRMHSYASWFALPLLWVTYEYLHSNWEFSFTWLHLGFGLSSFPWIAQFYEFTGYLGGSLTIMLFNVLFFLMINDYKNKLFKKWLYVAAAVTLIILTINMLLYPQPGQTKKVETVRVAIIQSNDDPYEELDKNSLKKQVADLGNMLLPLKNQNVDLVVLSEGFLKTSPMAPLILNNIDEQPAVKEIKKISRQINAPILVGFIGFKLYGSAKLAPVSALPTGDGRYFSGFNGAMLVAHDQPTQVQMKNNLVPFMERVPYLDQLSFFERFRLRLNQAVHSYEKDDEVNVFEYRNMRIGTLICLDALFPGYATEFVNKRANVMAVIANDSWAGNTSGYRQNAQYASTVAISLRRDVIRSATTGLSMFVDKSGKKRQITSWNKFDTVIDDVQLSHHDTFYTSINDWLGVASFVLVIVILIYVFTLKGKATAV